VGYQVRFENRTSRNSRVILMTEGLLLRKLIEDPGLEGVAGVILDEFHERSLDLDLSLALLKEIQGSFRPDLKIVVMSATLDPAPLLRYLPGSVLFDVPGRVFPVECRYSENPQLSRGVASVLPESGDVLVFLPGAFEIQKGVQELRAGLEREGVPGFEVLPLYASLPEEEQKKVFRDSGKRKIICATNIAETSITLPNIRAVVDSGWQKVMRMDPALGFDRLETLRISRASAEQRAGRAGRVSEGVVLRLWSAGEQEQLRHFETPEIQRVNLGRALLTLSEFGVRDYERFDWFEKPKSSMLDFAKEQLIRLGFLEEGGLTLRGKTAVRLPLPPALASIVLESAARGVPGFGARAAAVLDSISKEECIRDGEQFVQRLNRLTPLEQKAAAQILHSDAIPRAALEEFPVYEEVFIAAARSRICVGDRIVGRRRVRAREGRLPEVYLVLNAIDQGDLVASSWVPLSKSALLAHSQKKRQVLFDESALRVRGVQGLFFEDLALSTLTDVPPSADEAERELLRYLGKVRDSFLGRFPPVAEFLGRLRFVEEVCDTRVELPWSEILQAMVQGRTRLEDLEASAILPIIEGWIPRDTLHRLDSLAPRKIEVPSGSLIPIDYASRPPRISVRLQEVFGWRETPRVGGGREPLLMELLSPGFKPIQLTRDLKSFWASAYFEVKKELKARYPKHSWPDEPLKATPEAKGRRRG
jgi:ATP-dependent helicase HrpB